jgi:hypothetical protein
MNPNRSETIARRTGGLAMLAAPLLFLAGGAIHPTTTSDAFRQAAIIRAEPSLWYLAHLLLLVGFVALVPAVFAIGRRLRESAPGFRNAGLALMIPGAMLLVGLMALDGLGLWLVAENADELSTARVIDALSYSAGVVIPFQYLVGAVPIGFVVLAVGLARSRTTRPWIAWMLGFAGVGIFAGLASNITAVHIAGNVALLLSMGALGLEELGLSRAEIQTPLRTRTEVFVSGKDG